MTRTATRRSAGARAALWLPGLAVALGAVAATAHGLFEVALAAAVPAGIAWLYPLITDGLALVAYTATARLVGRAARYAWSVVVLAAGLSGLAQAAYLASGATLDASPLLRFGIGAWPAVAAAIAAHLLYLLAADPESTDEAEPIPSSRPPVHRGPVFSSTRPAVHPTPAAVDARPTAALTDVPRPALPAATDDPPTEPSTDTPVRVRARAVALRFAARHGALPTVNALAEAAQVSRGTAANVLKPLRDQPLPLHLITSQPDDPTATTTEEHTQP